MNDFLEDLRVFLEKYSTISREERDKAKMLISKHRNKCSVRSEGPCMGCGIHIEYDPCRTHFQRGDAWLDSFFGRWINDTKVTADSQYRNKVFAQYNGFRESTVRGYLCDDCWQPLAELGQQATEEYKAKRRERQQSERKQTALETDTIIKGEQKVSPAKRFHLMTSILSQASIDRLKGMDYQDFLSTFYWEIVRKYKMVRAGYKCELCNENGVLHVHHKTYEHHGEEHSHLEDLIVLCKDCHAKFHNIAE